MNSGRVGLTLFLVVTAALASYGVFTTPAPRPTAEIGTVDQFVCAPPQDTGALLTAPVQRPLLLPRPAPGTIPSGFTPAVALVCDTDVGRSITADGTTVYYQRRYEGDFSAALDAFDAPPTRWSPFEAQCMGYVQAAAPVDMWLVDSAGRAIQPSYPRGYCGLDNTLGLFEIQSLPEMSSVEHQVRLDAAGIAQFYSCSPTASIPAPGPRPLSDLHLAPNGFCRFDIAGPEPVFTGANRYDTTDHLDWNTAVADLAPAGACTERATSAATTSTYSAVGDEYVPTEVYVELDGCRRILADGFTPLSAPATILDALRNTT